MPIIDKYKNEELTEVINRFEDIEKRLDNLSDLNLKTEIENLNTKIDDAISDLNTSIDKYCKNIENEIEKLNNRIDAIKSK